MLGYRQSGLQLRSNLMKPLTKEDKEFLIDMVKLSANKYYKRNKNNLSIPQCLLIACKELGFSISPTTLSCLTYHIKNGKEV